MKILKCHKDDLVIIINIMMIITIDLTQLPYTKKHNINALYQEIKDRHSRDPPEITISVQHPSLKPTLRDYQKQAVVWMLAKESYQAGKLCDCDEKINNAQDKKCGYDSM
jgi:hypothetical protein